ncbi:MAG: porin, partial [bacterium]
MFRLLAGIGLLLLFAQPMAAQTNQLNQQEECGYENGFFCRNDWIGIRIENSARLLFVNQDNDIDIEIPRYRINLDGYFLVPELTFKISREFADGPQIKDAYLRWEFLTSPTNSLQIQTGRFKVPFSRQVLAGTNSRTLLDRSIAAQEFSLGRTSGAKLSFEHNKYIVADIGFFEGGTYAGRLLFSPTGERGFEESDWENKHDPEIAMAINYAHDGRKNRGQIGYDFLIKFRGASFQAEKIGVP